MANSKVASAATKKRRKRSIRVGVVHIHATFNNTIISVTDTEGNVISWSSAGKMGFKGSKKCTPYAAQMTTQDALERAMECSLEEVQVEILGPGNGREAALRALGTIPNLKVTMVTDNTRHPHNGCRPPKKRRV